MNKKKIVETLNDLIAKNYDAEKGYKEAAEDVDSAALKTMFKDYATQRYNFGHDLKDAIKQLGGEVEKGGTIGAAIHRAWIDLRSAIAGNDESAVLKEAIRGEDNALANYDEALEDMDGFDFGYQTVQRQRTQIQQAKSQLEQQLNVFEA